MGEPSSQAESFQICLEFDILIVYNYVLESVVVQKQSYVVIYYVAMLVCLKGTIHHIIRRSCSLKPLLTSIYQCCQHEMMKVHSQMN